MTPDPMLEMIAPELLERHVRRNAADDGYEFLWISPDGRETVQNRPDTPRDPEVKYLWPAGVELPIGVPDGMADRVADPGTPLVIVEGTKQYLAAATQALAPAPAGSPAYAVVGMSGCWGWRQEGRPLRDLVGIPMDNRDVVLVLDADRKSNPDVFDAAAALAEFCKVEGGAREVRYANVPGNKDGMDDVLGRVHDPFGVFHRIVRDAETRPGRRPAARRTGGARFFDNDGNLLAYDLYLAVAGQVEGLAVTGEDTIAVYEGGVYHNGESRYFHKLILIQLGNRFREAYLRTVHEIAVTELKTTGRVIPLRPDRRWINVRNGLLDPVTLELHPHDPDYLTLFQFDVRWDPDAECPIYEKWIEQVAPGRAEILEDAIAPMLDPYRTPARSLFLYGPSRSGKSTYGRLLKAVVGPESTSSVTLQQLSDDRFASANVYGKVLNLAMDLSSRDVRDLSVFKQLTGEDPVHANRKYGTQFSFTNTALMVFSANEVPTVSETSKAWTARVVPVSFPVSFLGAEDPSIEAAMMRDELPGIFRRWVLALREHLARGGYLEVASEDSEEFQRKTNRVSEYLYERTRPVERPAGVLRKELYADYRVWAENNGGAPLGRNRFMDSCRTLGVEEHKPEKSSWMFAVEIIDPESAEPKGPEGAERAESGPEGASEGPNLGTFGSLGTSEPILPLQVHTPETSNMNRGGQGSSEVPSVPESAEPLVYDLETGSAKRLWSAGPDFLRIVGRETAAGIVVTTDPGPIVAHGGPLVAHNGFQFDFHVLARHHGLDILELGEADRLIDTKVLAALADPPPFDMNPGQVERHYSLNRVAERLGAGSKVDDIKRLARRHHKLTPHPSGDPYMSIPTDDPEYLAYCAGDVEVTRAILEQLPITDYARREARLLARLAASVTGRGFRVDVDLVKERQGAGADRIAERRAWLVERYGLSDVRKDGTTTPTPHKTQAGKEAILAAFHDLGADPDRWPSEMRTTGGAPSLGKESMSYFLENAVDELEDAKDLARVVMELNGVRSVYQTVLDNLAGDRVHPTISARQASGRLSVTDPGLTVFGKRDGRWVEREVFLPDPGELIVCFDLDQVDARAVAALCQDPAYMALFTDPSIDSHEEIAYRLWGVRDGKKGRYRNMAKAIGHAWNYGAGTRRISAHTGIPIAEVEAFDEGMRRDFPGLVEWKRQTCELARQEGILLDNGFGRKMRPDPARAFTQGPALMGQGAARDLMMQGILDLPVEVVPMLRAVVHDEIVLSIPEDAIGDVVPVVTEALTQEFRGIPITTGHEDPATSWGQAYAPRRA